MRYTHLSSRRDARSIRTGSRRGGIAALTGFARNFDIGTTTLGVKTELALASVPLTFTTTLGWRHAFGDVVPSVLLGFQGGAQSFSVTGVRSIATPS